jgi:hypothetical protein
MSPYYSPRRSPSYSSSPRPYFGKKRKKLSHSKSESSSSLSSDSSLKIPRKLKKSPVNNSQKIVLKSGNSKSEMDDKKKIAIDGLIKKSEKEVNPVLQQMINSKATSSASIYSFLSFFSTFNYESFCYYIYLFMSLLFNIT